MIRFGEGDNAVWVNPRFVTYIQRDKEFGATAIYLAGDSDPFLVDEPPDKVAALIATGWPRSRSWRRKPTPTRSGRYGDEH